MIMKRNLILLASMFFIGATLAAQSYSVDTKLSTLKWTGKKVAGEHYGTIALKSGSLEVKNDKIVSGTFIIDMNSIVNADLESEEYNAKLVGHLKSDDFFGVKTYPTAKLEITGSTPFKNGEAKVNGKLTIKKITLPVEFTAKKNDKTYTATVTVDRTKYNIRYGSGSFFDNLGDNMIYDDFILEVKIITK
jgi:polyisoprenoid-binding protein YceI